MEEGFSACVRRALSRFLADGGKTREGAGGFHPSPGGLCYNPLMSTYHAAGGVVLDPDGRVLLLEREVWRNGAWLHEIRLPKGHVEAGETDAEAALREVGEESGYWGLAILADLGTTTVEFAFEGRHIRRHEHYFLMRLTDTRRDEPRPKHPHAEEARFRPLWARDLAEAEAWLTYASEKAVVRRAAERLSGQTG